MQSVIPVLAIACSIAFPSCKKDMSSAKKAKMLKEVLNTRYYAFWNIKFDAATREWITYCMNQKWGAWEECFIWLSVAWRDIDVIFNDDPTSPTVWVADPNWGSITINKASYSSPEASFLIKNGFVSENRDDRVSNTIKQELYHIIIDNDGSEFESELVSLSDTIWWKDYLSERLYNLMPVIADKGSRDAFDEYNVPWRRHDQSYKFLLEQYNFAINVVRPDLIKSLKVWDQLNWDKYFEFLKEDKNFLGDLRDQLLIMWLK